MKNKVRGIKGMITRNFLKANGFTGTITSNLYNKKIDERVYLVYDTIPKSLSLVYLNTQGKEFLSLEFGRDIEYTMLFVLAMEQITGFVANLKIGSVAKS